MVVGVWSMAGALRQQFEFYYYYTHVMMMLLVILLLPITPTGQPTHDRKLIPSLVRPIFSRITSSMSAKLVGHKGGGV